MPNLFSVPIFFVLFRETLEASLIVSILLSFLHQTLIDDPVTKKRLTRQVWLGAALGFAICLAIGAAFIAVFYTVASDLWSKSEDIWEGCFCLVAVVLITLMAIAMLKTSHLHEKWKRKIGAAVTTIEDASAGTTSSAGGFYESKRRRYAMFFLPFITVLREGLEAVVFIGGVSIGQAPTSIPLAAVVGILCGFGIGFLVFKGGNAVRLKYFFIASTCLLLLISAGLFARAIAFFEDYNWKKLSGANDEGTGPGRQVSTIVWHLTCCNPEATNTGGWELFNAFLGWSNTATIATITGYIAYWVVLILGLVAMRLRERQKAAREAKLQGDLSQTSSSSASDAESGVGKPVVIEKEKAVHIDIKEPSTNLSSQTSSPNTLHEITEESKPESRA